MTALTSEQMREAHHLATQLQRGDKLSQCDLDTLSAEWEPTVQPSEKDRVEHFAIVHPDGTPIGVTGPRWLFHLFGLRHRAVEIAMATPTGLIVLQRRSSTKDEWPGLLDMAVAGHIPQRDDGSDMSFEEGAWKEIAEEIGLRQQDANSVLVGGRLAHVGAPYFCFEGDWRRNPPFLDAEVRQIYAATLTGEGLGRLHFADGEVGGILLASVDTAWQILREDTVASGLRYSLPRYLDWLEQISRPTA
jgi:isopentenyldiphosphate isomerase